MAQQRGLDEQDAQDAVQDLFLRLVQLDQLTAVVQLPEPEQQAAFLLKRLNWRLHNRWRDQYRQRRGGGIIFVSIHDNTIHVELADHHTPERHLAANWAREVFNVALAHLHDEMKHTAWNELEPFLHADTGSAHHPQPGALRVALHRARQRLQWLIAREVHGATCPEDAAAELLSALR